MSMSKKDFIALADAIIEHNRGLTRSFDTVQLSVLADVLQHQNPRFNRDRWLGYIAGTNGPSGGAVKGKPWPCCQGWGQHDITCARYGQPKD